MKCPVDGKTRMTDGIDYINSCPHCGATGYASERAIRDIVRNVGKIWDYSLPLDKFLLQFARGFRDMGLKAWERTKGKDALKIALEDLKCTKKDLQTKIKEIFEYTSPEEKKKWEENFV